ncbi:HAD family hydrolase [Brenneria izadpanahii]|uniref:phosphoglycolate phosphatase n=1 Tax=Brenneria izadpanahii TaxID=2722756 RepID=A0ABX7UYR0_9GAMM|nr:HAD family hydrolase [Brenneria izadpanahii]QTF08689.1 HAD family hydrolase [Brenneria izadpanahii]
MRFKGLLFDKDGTLLEFHSMWLLIARAVAARLLQAHPNVTVSAQSLLTAIGASGDRIANHGLLATHPAEDIAKAWYRLMAISGDLALFTRQVKGLFNSQVEENPLLIRALPGVKETLAGLKEQGFKLGVATADSKDATIFSLEKAGIYHLFDYIGYSDGDIAPKPAPVLLHRFCARCDLNAGDIVIFGDTVSDMLFGRNAGAKRVGVLTGAASREDLEPYADMILSSVADFNAFRLRQLDYDEGKRVWLE